MNAAMPAPQPERQTRYVGVFCPEGHFNPLSSYDVEHPDAPCRSYFTLDHLTEFQCKECGRTFECEQGDVAHSNWADGRAAHFPPLVHISCPFLLPTREACQIRVAAARRTAECRILHTLQVKSRHNQFGWSQLGNSQVYSVVQICR